MNGIAVKNLHFGFHQAGPAEGCNTFLGPYRYLLNPPFPNNLLVV
jgi:hypothetical protein